MGLVGEDVTLLRNSNAKFEIPVWVTLLSDQHGSLEALLKLRVRSR